jgi:hypothetical protein
MGNWNISINGVGAHHNKRFKKDVNRMTAQFVQALKDAGHSVTSATFTHGGADDVTDADQYLKTRDQVETE